MKRKLFNLFLFIAVPVVTGFKFHITGIGRNNITIIGNRTGLPAIWDQKFLYKHWWDIKTLKQCEWETEIMSYENTFDEEIENAEI